MADMDELLELCRDKQSKQFLVDAVACYRANAYRAAIVMTWEAVVYDIISKIRELDSTGDAAARSLVSKIQKLDKASCAKFEQEILQQAKGLELLDDRQELDLGRLKEDRNSCAHPSMNVDGEVFQPAPECARMHIRHAVEHLLAQPPVQGKKGLAYLERDLLSSYFPDNWEGAKAHLMRGPLQRASPGLVRNWLRILLKCGLGVTSTTFVLRQILASLRAVYELYPAATRELLAVELDPFIEKVRLKPGDDQSRWNHVLAVIKALPGSYDYLSESTRSYLAKFLTSDDEERITGLALGWKIPDLREFCELQISGLDNKDFFTLAGLQPNRERIDEALRRLRMAETFSVIGYMYRQIVTPHMSFLTEADARHIEESGSANGQVGAANLYPKVLKALRQSGLLPKEAADEVRDNFADDLPF